jgi:PadR family transcriptional regulator PadR
MAAGRQIGLRIMPSARLVSRALPEDPAPEWYRLRICALAGLPSATMHRIVARLEAAGWSRNGRMPDCASRVGRVGVVTGSPGLLARDGIARGASTRARRAVWPTVVGGAAG